MDVPVKSTSMRNALLSVIISTIMVLISGGLLLLAHVNEDKSQVFNNAQFEQVKQELRSDPDNQNLQWSVRELDRRLRNEYIFSRQLADNSRYLLVIAVLALIISSRIYVNLRIVPAIPENDCKCQQQLTRQYSTYGMLAVICIFAVSGSIFLISGFLPEKAAPEPVTDYASVDILKQNWPRFRGFAGSGVVLFDNVPLEFNLETGENVSWTAELELPGFNSPIIFTDKVFLSGANELLRKVYCFELAGGKLLWSAQVDIADRASDKVPDIMEDTGFAASSLATDGTYVYSIFANGDTACHDFTGKQVWARNLGLPESTYGFSASLDTWQGNVLIQFDQGYDEQEPMAELISIDGATGNINWRVKRPVINSWTSPIVAETAGKWQLITVSNPWAIGYDPATGVELWRFGSVNGDTAPSPVVASDMTFAISPYESIKAIKTSLAGDISTIEPVWTGEEGVPDTTSPVTDGNKIWFLTADGTLTCYNLDDGQKLYDYSLGSFAYCSPTLVKDKLLFFSMDGQYTVLSIADNEPKVVFEAAFDDKICSCPSFVEGKMIIRTDSKLYCIGSK